MKIALCCPNRDSDFKGETVSTIARLIWDICALGHQPMYISSNSCFIDKARNMLWDVVKEQHCDYMMFIDSDVACANPYTDNIIQKMLEINKDVVIGLYVDKRPPYRMHAYNFTADGKMMNIPTWPKEPFKVDAGGTGFMLISKKCMDAFTPEVIEKVGTPFSFIHYGTQHELGEDVSFCKRVANLEMEIWADPSISLVHYGKESFTAQNYEMMKEMSAQRFEHGIDGWMAPIELEFLYTLAQKHKTIVEIGSWKGRSTRALLDAEPAKVFAIDTWEGSKDPNDLTYDQAKKDDIFAIFRKNVGHYKNLKWMKKSSLDAVKMFSDKSVDMVFIDAEHTYDSVKADIEAWLPKSKRIICGHDYAKEWPGVMKAVDEKFGDKVRTIASIWYVEL